MGVMNYKRMKDYGHNVYEFFTNYDTSTPIGYS